MTHFIDAKDPWALLSPENMMEIFTKPASDFLHPKHGRNPHAQHAAAKTLRREGYENFVASYSASTQVKDVSSRLPEYLRNVRESAGLLREKLRVFDTPAEMHEYLQPWIGLHQALDDRGLVEALKTGKVSAEVNPRGRGVQDYYTAFAARNAEALESLSQQAALESRPDPAKKGSGQPTIVELFSRKRKADALDKLPQPFVCETPAEKDDVPQPDPSVPEKKLPQPFVCETPAEKDDVPQSDPSVPVKRLCTAATQTDRTVTFAFEPSTSLSEQPSKKKQKCWNVIPPNYWLTESDIDILVRFFSVRQVGWAGAMPPDMFLMRDAAHVFTVVNCDRSGTSGTHWVVVYSSVLPVDVP
eukprot:TRINITY_DN20635_c0_g1_i4.p1 TRINITY_DN20635_c0_g1~~TRINITY_DN20635_c0_g1_i4.p1  ORF type:complete len:358 (-),score=19.12 TRINITY_DN20635_c0_g1_i4:75-1148(-)